MTYEYSLPPVRKVKTIALKASKASKKKSRVLSDEDSDIDEDSVAMLAKNFEHFMKNNKFKKTFSDRLRKAPHTIDTEEVEKKDPRGPQCFECSGFGHIRTECANLKKQRGKAFNATLSDESEKEEETPEEEKVLAFVAPHEDKEDSQSYYSENSEEEDMQSAYQLQYVEFLKLREKYKQQVLELNSLRIEKTSMLIKINDLEDRLLKTQLQLERVLDEKLTHMLSIQKCPTDKTRLRYVPPSIYDTPSTSKTIFVKPVIPKSPPSRVDKGKAIMKGEVPIIPQPPTKLPIRRKPLACHHYGEPGHIRPNCPHQQFQRKKKWQAPKTPMCHQCGVSSHVRPKCSPPKSPRQHRPPPINHTPRHQQLQKPIQAKKSWVPKKLYLEKQKTAERKICCEGNSPASSFMQDLVRFLTLQLKKEGQDKDEDTHSQKGSRPT
jgi:hypothetical protein